MKNLRAISFLILLAAGGALRADLDSPYISAPVGAASRASFKVVFNVRNTGTTTTAGVAATLAYSLEAGSVTASAVASPAAADLGPGESRDFTFTFSAVGCGTIIFSGSAMGSDLSLGMERSPVAWRQVVISCAPPITAIPGGEGSANIPNNMFKPYHDGPLKFRFTVPEAGTVTLKIYDRNGKNIYSREKDALAGEGSIEWDGRNSAGDVAATGIYMASFQGKGLRKTLKFAVIK
jgi:hypothetical protein